MASARSLRQSTYLWKNVQIVDARFVDGMVFRPTAHNVRYVRTDIGGAYCWDARAVVWDFETSEQRVGNRSYYTRLVPNRPAAPVEVQITHLAPNEAYRLEVHRTEYRPKDADYAYIEMGSPNNLSAKQIAHLSDLTQDLPETDKTVHSGPTGAVELTLQMNSSEIALVKLTRSRGGRTASVSGVTPWSHDFSDGEILRIGHDETLQVDSPIFSFFFSKLTPR